MNRKRLFTGGVGGVAMLMLILDAQTAIEGASGAVEMCLHSLIPSLFPFLVASSLLTGVLSGQAYSVAAVGLLGGYPVGAEAVSRSCREGMLSREDGERMLAFCSNAGPSFLFGIIGRMFERPCIPWLLWGIHIAGAAAAWMAAAPTWPKTCKQRDMTMVQALQNALKTMATVCGWVVLFRVMIGFLEKWLFWVFPAAVQVLLSGLLELSNGCLLLGEIESQGLRYLVAGVMLAFGGCCVTMQTASVCDGISLRWYFPGKVLQCCVSVILSCGTQFVFAPEEQYGAPAAVLIAATAGAISMMAVLRSYKKSSSNLACVGV